MPDSFPAPPPLPDPAAHKGEAGRLIAICGSPTMPGAAQLVLRAAQRAGCGLATLAVFQRELIGLVAPAVAEAIYLDLSRSKDLYAGRLPREIEEHDHHVRLAGPGLGSGGYTRELVRRLLTSSFSGPLVLDADALNVLAGAPEALTERAGPVVVTPHPGEAARLLERSVPRDDGGRLECACELAHRAGALCVLKGHRTVVSDGERVWTNDTGNAGMATAGSGDVLAGILGAYLCVAEPETADDGGDGWGVFEAVCAAVRVHGRAGDRAAQRLGPRALIASDLVAELGAAQLEERGGRATG